MQTGEKTKLHVMIDAFAEHSDHENDTNENCSQNGLIKKHLEIKAATLLSVAVAVDDRSGGPVHIF